LAPRAVRVFVGTGPQGGSGPGGGELGGARADPAPPRCFSPRPRPRGRAKTREGQCGGGPRGNLVFGGLDFGGGRIVGFGTGGPPGFGQRPPPPQNGGGPGLK